MARVGVDETHPWAWDGRVEREFLVVKKGAIGVAFGYNSR